MEDGWFKTGDVGMWTAEGRGTRCTCVVELYAFCIISIAIDSVNSILGYALCVTTIDAT